MLYDVPLWRILKDGERSKHMPGGIKKQRELLRSECFSELQDFINYFEKF